MSSVITTAPIGRRIIALLIDWGLALAISAGFFGGSPWATLLIFAVMTWLLLATLNATIGHTLTGLVVRRTDGAAAGPGAVALRTLGVMLVIPAVVWGPDGRGLHDMWGGTMIGRR